MKVLIEKSPFIEIKLVEGNAIKKTEELKINAMGLINSKREHGDDHYVYFGSSAEMNGKVVNDVVCSKADNFAE